MPSRPRRLLSIAHSYVVTLNRRLAHEMVRVEGEPWEVTAVAPTYFHGGRDLRPNTLERLPEEPCALVPVPAYLTRRVHFFFYGSRLCQLLAEPWDMVHCWQEPYILAGYQVAWCCPRQTPIVYVTAQNLSKQYPPPFNWFERGCLRRAAGWMAFGRTIADTLRTRPGYVQKPSEVIPLGVDTDLFRPDAAAGAAVRQKLGWTGDGPPVVGFLGRFVPEKGVRLLRKVFDRLTTPWRALFVGAGPLEKEIRTWATRYGERVRVCSDVRHADVPGYLNAMDLLCAPSQTTPRCANSLAACWWKGLLAASP